LRACSVEIIPVFYRNKSKFKEDRFG
jgi:hypothetical protein